MTRNLNTAIGQKSLSYIEEFTEVVGVTRSGLHKLEKKQKACLWVLYMPTQKQNQTL